MKKKIQKYNKKNWSILKIKNKQKYTDNKYKKLIIYKITRLKKYNQNNMIKFIWFLQV